jgi:hypothetical protein
MGIIIHYFPLDSRSSSSYTTFMTASQRIRKFRQQWHRDALRQQAIERLSAVSSTAVDGEGLDTVRPQAYGSPAPYSPDWHREAFCDWQPIQQRTFALCAGGCGVHTEVTETSGAYCLRCSINRKGN